MSEFMSVSQAAQAWGISERMVRNYCAAGRVPGAFRVGRSWSIPSDVKKPRRTIRSDARQPTLLEVLQEQSRARLPGGIYHRLQIDLTYNSNHIEGSRLTEDQTRLIFETSTIGVAGEPLRVDDIVETVNHFRCIDFVIETAHRRLTQPYIKRLHLMLKTGTQDAARSWFVVGDYKGIPNEVGGHDTAAPEDVPQAMGELLDWYEGLDVVGLAEVLEFHWRFETIHPFRDGNGRVGRLIMLKECLRHGIVPFIITDDLKLYYHRGLSEYPKEPGYLEGTALTAQDRFREVLRHFRAPLDE